MKRNSATESGPTLETKTHVDGSPCGLMRRLAIIVYDAAIVIALLILATGMAMLAGFGERTAMKDPLFTLYLFAIWFLYIGWFWHKGGMTVGMRAWRVRIENEAGNRPGWGQVAIRFLTSLVSMAFAGIGFFWSLADSRKRTWHDILSNTRLLRY